MKRNILGGGEVCRRKPAMASFLCSRRSSHLPEKCLGLTILDLTIFGFDNIGFDNIGFDYMAIGKFAINNIGLHIIAIGNIGIGRQSFHSFQNLSFENKVAGISMTENWIYCFCKSSFLRILLKQDTALLSHCPCVRSCVTGVTSQLFSIIWWFRAWKPCIFWKHVILAISVHEPNPLGPCRPTPWPPGTLQAYPLTPWDPVGLSLDPLGPWRPS